jgi:hypothetical protein
LARLRAVEEAMHGTFSPEVVDELRLRTGYNPRQRVGTAVRLMVTVVEGFLLGQTMSFTSLRAIFIRRFGFIRSCPFQNRFKQATAAAFFRDALNHLVTHVLAASKLSLGGPLGGFADVRLYDGTGQRVPPRGRKNLPACTKGKAGSKWVVGYSLMTGMLEHLIGAAETASETPLWHQLVPVFQRGALYVFDLGFFERALFTQAQSAGAHVLLRLKASAKVRVVGHMTRRGYAELPNWSLGYYLGSTSCKRGTYYDLDVVWGKGRNAVALRLVGYAHSYRQIRWYLTTVPRTVLTPDQLVQTYRLRWLIELLFRELKQNADLGRSATGNRHAVEALTYGAALAHALVRSLRIHAALRHDIDLHELRQLASLHVARAFARDIIDALVSPSLAKWSAACHAVADALMPFGHEPKPSRSRPRIGINLGASGA